MELTRYEHACVVLEQDGRRLVIDPPVHPIPRRSPRVVAVVATHEHPDHWTEEHLAALREGPGCACSARRVALAASGQPVERVRAGDVVEVEGFRLEFFGAEHAVIHSSIPVVDNVGVLVDDAFYYGGDSHSSPAARSLCSPPRSGRRGSRSARRWTMLAVAPGRAFAVHDRPLSEVGLRMQRDRLAWPPRRAAARSSSWPGDTLAV